MGRTDGDTVGDTKLRVGDFLRRTWVLYLLILPLPVYYLVVADTMDPRSVALPRLIAWSMVGLAALIAILQWRAADGSHDESTIGAFWATWKKTIGMAILSAALVAGFAWLGFYPAAAIFLFVSFTLLQTGGVVNRLLFTAGVLAGCYLLFEVLLGVRLP